MESAKITIDEEARVSDADADGSPKLKPDAGTTDAESVARRPGIPIDSGVCIADPFIRD